MPNHVYGIWLSIQPTSAHSSFSIFSFPVKGNVNMLLFMSWSVTALDVQGPQHGQISWELDFRISWFFAFYRTESPSLIREQTICHSPNWTRNTKSLSLRALLISKDKQIKQLKVLSKPNLISRKYLLPFSHQINLILMIFSVTF